MSDSDDLVDQALDMLFSNDSIKKKSYPYILTGVVFNILLLVTVATVAVSMCRMNRKLGLICSKFD